MNLHNIRARMANIDLIAQYCTAYYAMPFRVCDDGVTVEYQPAHNGNWMVINERETLTYTNAALQWERDGRNPYPR